MGEKFVIYNGEKLEKPKRNTLGLGILEYLFWFFLPILVLIFLVGFRVGYSEIDPVTKEVLQYTLPNDVALIMAVFSFLCWFIIGPIFAIFGVITRPLLMRPKKVKKIHEKKARKLQLSQPLDTLQCSKCFKAIPPDSILCPYCATRLDNSASSINNNRKRVLIDHQKSEALYKIVIGFIAIIVGILLTIATYMSDSPVYIVFWGAVAFGIISIIRGLYVYLKAVSNSQKISNQIGAGINQPFNQYQPTQQQSVFYVHDKSHKFCPQCGHKNQKDSSFCSQCGEKF